MMDYSVIIPVYNCKEYLPACVESVRAVGVPSYEILLIDDGSTDGSGTLCDTLAAQYSEIRVVHQVNSGASAARNRGIREARGEYVLFLDADDSIDPVLLGKILGNPRITQTDLTIFGLTFDYYHNGSCYRRDPMFYKFDGILSRDTWTGAFAELFAANSLSSLCNKVFRRQRLLEQGLNETMFLYEDLEFVLRYLQRCGSIWNVPAAVYHYRQSEDEGNAGRRLARIGSIPDFLVTIEAALSALTDVPRQQREQVVVQLHQVLAWEKIKVSDLAGIRRICREYAEWYQHRDMISGQGKFHQQLMEGKAISLMLQSKKTALRHTIAVRVKACLKRMR